MSIACPSAAATMPRDRLARVGEAMVRHRRAILTIQWVVVIFYLTLVALPAFRELPPESAHLWNDLTRFAQFVFWGIWWPFVILSVMLLGRAWCGLLCPEGALTELASRHGLGRAIPRWIKWSGWPFTAFLATTVYGQLVSVYEYPKPVLLILGGSTLAAIAVGFLYGRGTRVWCRHLCPVSGVFGLLARLAPLHFAVDRGAWRRSLGAHHEPVTCAPLVDLRDMKRAKDCQMCGKCSGHRSAIVLSARAPGAGVLGMTAVEPDRWEARLLVFGAIGVALGAFQWSASPWFVAVKQAVATWLIEHDALLLLQDHAPWWVLTHYPETNDVFTWLDGTLIVGYIGATALAVGGSLWLALLAAARLLRRPGFHLALAYTLTPLAGASVFLGLSMLTVNLLRAEGFSLAWVAAARVGLLAAALAWSAWLAWHRIATAKDVSVRRRAAARGALMTGMSVPVFAWALLFFAW